MGLDIEAFTGLKKYNKSARLPQVFGANLYMFNFCYVEIPASAQSDSYVVDNCSDITLTCKVMHAPLSYSLACSAVIP